MRKISTILFALVASITMMQAETVNLKTLTAPYTAQDGDVLTDTTYSQQVSIAASATVTLNNVKIDFGGSTLTETYNGITCLGDATIILVGDNAVRDGGLGPNVGIYVPANKTLTIQGDGRLSVTEVSLSGAGIGGTNGLNAGNIIIKSGTVETSGANGLGGGPNAACGDITIESGITSVIVHWREQSLTNGIGACVGGTCGTITIDPSLNDVITGANERILTPKEDQTAIDEVNANAKAAKCIVNGQLLINYNGKTYNALGVEVK